MFTIISVMSRFFRIFDTFALANLFLFNLSFVQKSLQSGIWLLLSITLHCLAKSSLNTSAFPVKRVMNLSPIWIGGIRDAVLPLSRIFSSDQYVLQWMRAILDKTLVDFFTFQHNFLHHKWDELYNYQQKVNAKVATLVAKRLKT